MNLLDARRRVPRIAVDGFCSVATDDALHHAQLTDLSTLGLRIERPSPPAMQSNVQLEIELPGLDEVVWASAVVTDIRISYLPGRRHDGRRRWTCQTGLRIAAISASEQRLLRDYVVEQMRARRCPTVERRREVRVT